MGDQEKPKTRGEILGQALEDAGAINISIHFAGYRHEYPAAQLRVLDRAAEIYDAATRATLPDNVEAFVAEQEAASKVPMNFIPTACKSFPKLIAIIRAQGEEIARMKLAAESRAAVAANLEDVARETCAERDALRDRLAKLEKAASVVMDSLSVHILPRAKHVDELRSALNGVADGTTEKI